jgi:hypothetical protein
MDYDMVNNMKVEELKCYLRLRGLKISGKKAVLVARTFSAMENNVVPIMTAEEVENEIRQEYQKKLKLNDIDIPDPFKVETNWLSEVEGLIHWPTVLYPDIYNYLMFNPAELASADLSDYKSCKAYSYYKCGWLQQLFYHEITVDSPFCILKAECRKSERINDPFHKLWITFNKMSAKIMSAHCTCMAGLSQTCNHVAAALFRIEAAVRNGLTNPACTSEKSEWLPNRAEIAPTKVCDMNFNRDDFGMRGKKKRSLVGTPKRNFDPIANSSQKLLNLSDIAKALETVAPLSIIFQAVPKPEIDFVREVIAVKKFTTELVSVDDVILMSDSIKSFEENLITNMSANSIKDIEEVSRGQSANELWFAFRKGVITASRAHDVLAKMKKTRKYGNKHIDTWSLNQTISGMTLTNPNLPALKYGNTMEIEASNTFYELMKTKHSKLTVTECGLYLDIDIPYIGGSPDRIVNCLCCPPACLEIKCPYSINFTSPKDEKVNLPYIKKDHAGNFTLNRNHRYYTQCQVQMAVARINFGYFMVWTPHGHIVEKLTLDKELWQAMKNDFFKYYNEHYLTTIFSS